MSQEEASSLKCCSITKTEPGPFTANELAVDLQGCNQGSFLTLPGAVEPGPFASKKVHWIQRGFKGLGFKGFPEEHHQ